MGFKEWFDEFIHGKKVADKPQAIKSIDLETYQRLLEKMEIKRRKNKVSHSFMQWFQNNPPVNNSPLNNSYHSSHSSASTWSSSSAVPNVELLLQKTLDTEENKDAIEQLLTAVRTQNKAMLLLIAKNNKSDNFVKQYLAKLAMTELGIVED